MLERPDTSVTGKMDGDGAMVTSGDKEACGPFLEDTRTYRQDAVN